MLGNIVSRPARDLTFSLSKVLNDITGIAKHYWMNVMIDLAVTQSDHVIFFWSLHASHITDRAGKRFVQTGWSRFHLFFKLTVCIGLMLEK